MCLTAAMAPVRSTLARQCLTEKFTAQTSDMEARKSSLNGTDGETPKPILQPVEFISLPTSQWTRDWLATEVTVISVRGHL